MCYRCKYCWEIFEICNLELLNIEGNAIGDDGISVMTDGLQQKNTLTKLFVYSHELSAKGTI